MGKKKGADANLTFTRSQSLGSFQNDLACPSRGKCQLEARETYPITAECSRLIKLPSTMVYGKSAESNTLDLG